MDSGDREDSRTPSFSIYSAGGLEETAARVSAEEPRIDGDFEFAFQGVAIGDTFPVFVLKELESESRIANSLRDLFIDDRDQISCSSSSDDELERVPPETYCVWPPRTSAPPRLSSSLKGGSSRSASLRWKLRNFLQRSYSDGKTDLAPGLPAHRTAKSSARASGGRTSAAGVKSPSAHEELYVRNRLIKEVQRKKSYLPYKQDVLGFSFSAFSNRFR